LDSLSSAKNGNKSDIDYFDFEWNGVLAQKVSDLLAQFRCLLPYVHEWVFWFKMF
jgi:hypothetical protein